MTFCNTHVEHALWQFLHHDIHAATRWHGRSYTHNLLVLLSQFEQCLAKHFLEFRRTRILVLRHQALARFLVKLTRSMPHSCVFLSGSIAFSLHGVDMKQLRSFHLPDCLQHSHQFHHIMSIGRAKIADVHALKHVLLAGEHRLQTVVEANNALSALLIEHTPIEEFS